MNSYSIIHFPPPTPQAGTSIQVVILLRLHPFRRQILYPTRLPLPACSPLVISIILTATAATFLTVQSCSIITISFIQKATEEPHQNMLLGVNSSKGISTLNLWLLPIVLPRLSIIIIIIKFTNINRHHLQLLPCRDMVEEGREEILIPREYTRQEKSLKLWQSCNRIPLIFQLSTFSPQAVSGIRTKFMTTFPHVTPQCRPSTFAKYPLCLNGKYDQFNNSNAIYRILKTFFVFFTLLLSNWNLLLYIPSFPPN